MTHPGAKTGSGFVVPRPDIAASKNDFRLPFYKYEDSGKVLRLWTMNQPGDVWVYDPVSNSQYGYHVDWNMFTQSHTVRFLGTDQGYIPEPPPTACTQAYPNYSRPPTPVVGFNTGTSTPGMADSFAPIATSIMRVISSELSQLLLVPLLLGILNLSAIRSSLRMTGTARTFCRT